MKKKTMATRRRSTPSHNVSGQRAALTYLCTHTILLNKLSETSVLVLVNVGTCCAVLICAPQFGSVLMPLCAHTALLNGRPVCQSLCRDHVSMGVENTHSGVPRSPAGRNRWEQVSEAFFDSLCRAASRTVDVEGQQESNVGTRGPKWAQMWTK